MEGFSRTPGRQSWSALNPDQISRLTTPLNCVLFVSQSIRWHWACRVSENSLTGFIISCWKYTLQRALYYISLRSFCVRCNNNKDFRGQACVAEPDFNVFSIIWSSFIICITFSLRFFVFGRYCFAFCDILHLLFMAVLDCLTPRGREKGGKLWQSRDPDLINI